VIFIDFGRINLERKSKKQVKGVVEDMKKIATVLFSLVFLLSSCIIVQTGVEEETQAPPPASTNTTQPTTPPATEPEPTSTLTLEETAERVINALRAKDLAAVAEFVHPSEGVRFSPYGYVQESHQVFMPGDLAELAGSEEVYVWGQYDGSGEPIELTFDAYYDEFVYTSDFANAEQIAVNQRLGQGNTINNISEFYPDSSFVEYHFSGFDPEYEGMDWESLRLVFKQENGTWFLVGVVHDQWTI
jgi:hypothetical protein